ncbi:MAG: tetratricopeptide repeat protein [Planctomycetes bacterium]|nr:tetratricopeptide repeat protein [Planctomycetota bacterium]
MASSGGAADRPLRGHLNLGDDAAALADCERALALDPGDALARRNLGIARLRLGDVAGAVADWEAALRLAPDAPWADRVRGMLAGARSRLEGR